MTIPVGSSDTTRTVSPASLTFTSANWNSNQTVTATGGRSIVDGNVVYTITLGAANSVDTKYNGVNPADVSVTNTDFGDAYPTVVSTSPGSGTTDIGVNTIVTATFSEPLNHLTIDTSTFTLNSSSGMATGTVGYDGDNYTATFTPANRLSYLTTYTATLTTGVTDAAGDSMQQNHTWSFTTSAAVTTGTATSVTLRSAMLHGRVNPNGTSTTVQFEYGTASGSYSIAMTPQIINGTTTVGVSASISGLDPWATYYCRVAAWNGFSASKEYGSETTFLPKAQIAGSMGDHSLTLKTDGTVWAWGYNRYGLGSGTMTSSYTPVRVSVLSGVIAIATGKEHSLALNSDGTVQAWGNNNYGQLGLTVTIVIPRRHEL